MKYYCIGIKGSGMSTLAQILYDLGNEVIGYDDVKDYKFTQEGIDKRNIKIYYDSNHELDKDVIVTYSKAFSEEHKEIRRVRELGLQMKEYNELLGDLSKMFETIAVSGTHGKTTTSTMISHILKDTIGCNYFIGDGSGFASKENNKFILESCEFKKHFLAYKPYYAIVTNIELEHTEVYKDIDEIIKTFEEFANKAHIVIACGDDSNIKKMKLNNHAIYYGFNKDNNIYADNVLLTDTGSTFDVYLDNNFYGHFDIPLYGKHMILNTLACILICNLYSIDKNIIQEKLKTFENAKRRFKETKIGDIVTIDDYAHHPTELKVTINAAKQKYPNKKVIAVFLPNTYSRTLALKEDFIEVLKDADKAYVMDIKCDREKKEDYENVSSDMLIEKIDNAEKLSIDTVDKLSEYDNAVICFMSCANISPVIDKYHKLLKEVK